MIQRFVPDTVSLGAREKCALGLRVPLLGKGQSQETTRKWSLHQLPIVSMEIPGRAVASFPQILWKHAFSSFAEFAIVPWKGANRALLVTVFGSIFGFFYIKQLPRGDRHTCPGSQNAEILGLSCFLTLLLPLHTPINLSELWSSLQGELGTCHKFLWVHKRTSHFHTTSRILRGFDGNKYSINNHLIVWSMEIWSIPLHTGVSTDCRRWALMIWDCVISSSSDSWLGPCVSQMQPLLVRFSPKNFASNFGMILPPQRRCLMLMRWII